MAESDIDRLREEASKAFASGSNKWNSVFNKLYQDLVIEGVLTLEGISAEEVTGQCSLADYRFPRDLTTLVFRDCDFGGSTLHACLLYTSDAADE